MSRKASTAMAMLAVAILYIAAGKLGLSMAFLNASVSPVWPPTGVALAAIMLLGYRVWPAVLIGAFVVNFSQTHFLSTSLAISAGNTLEAVFGAIMARRFAGGLAAFDRPGNIFRFVFFAAVPSTIISATVGVTALGLAAPAPWKQFSELWTIWWLGDFVGAIVVTPIFVVWAKSIHVSKKLGPALEVLALSAVLIALDYLIFIRWHVFNGPRTGHAYLAVPPMIWAAFRFRQRGAVTSAFVLSAVAILGTVNGTGPFASSDAIISLLVLQAFVAVNTLMALVLAAVVDERAVAFEEREQSLQRERIARADAENANHAKDQFLAVLSHELRTPLTPALLTASLLETSPDLPPQFLDRVQMIRRNIELEARLIDDLLDLTRISRGKLQLNLNQADLHRLLKNTIELCCSQRLKDITTDLQATGCQVRGDPARLQQIFWNLLNNAAKFTPAGKPITVRTRNPDPNTIEIVIEDKGIGIDPSVLPRLFDAFQQGDISRVRTFGGLGLGLAITKALVQAHHGTVTAQSPGRDAGAIFTVVLPILVAPASDSPPTPPPQRTSIKPARRTAKVLLVEDNAETLKVLAIILRRLGHDVTTASTVKSATESARLKEFDLIISDLGLPDGEGYDLMRSLPHRIPAIALSGYGMSDDVQRSHDAGFADHLVKPIDFKTLEESMTRLLEPSGKAV